MTEVEKMYENAGIEKSCNSDSEFCPVAFCDECNFNIYPPFTAEKQVELIKWLARRGLIQINYSSHQCYQFNSFRVGGDYKTDISEALASHCNYLWQDLTEEERKQIKNILE